MSDLVAAVRAGHLISFPTDTVPALAATPDQAEQIYALKQRQADKPLILMGAAAADLWPFVQGQDAAFPFWERMAQQHWPGALTLVLPASPRVPPAMTPLNPGTIGLRVPQHPLALALLQQTGPLATTSVNRSGSPALTHLANIEATFPQLLTPLAADWQQAEPQLDAPVRPKSPSTVIAWTGQGWQTLRAGAIRIDEAGKSTSKTEH